MAANTKTSTKSDSQKAFDSGKKLVMRVSARDVEIYEKCVIAGRKQRDVALEYKLTQPRVSGIVQRIKRWLCQLSPLGLNERHREHRLYEAWRTHKMRLEYCYQEAMRAWEESRKTKITVTKKIGKGGESEQRVAAAQTGNRLLLADAVKYASLLVQFDGFQPDGTVDASCKGRLHEAPELPPREQFEKIKAWVARVDAQEAAAKRAEAGEQRAGSRGCEPANNAPANVIEARSDVITAPADVIKESAGVIEGPERLSGNADEMSYDEAAYKVRDKYVTNNLLSADSYGMADESVVGRNERTRAVPAGLAERPPFAIPAGTARGTACSGLPADSGRGAGEPRPKLWNNYVRYEEVKKPERQLPYAKVEEAHSWA